MISGIFPPVAVDTEWEEGVSPSAPKHRFSSGIPRQQQPYIGTNQQAARMGHFSLALSFQNGDTQHVQSAQSM